MLSQGFLGGLASVLRPSLLNNMSFLTQNNAFSSNFAFLSDEDETYDLVCIGGGSGGLATALEAGRVGMKNKKNLKIAIVDQNDKLGGTALNVGEVPKKLMHFASIMGTELKNADKFGWVAQSGASLPTAFQWQKLVQAVENHVVYEHTDNYKMLEKYNIEQVKGSAKFLDPNTLEATSKTGEKRILKSKRFVVAVGGRPRIPPTPGAFEYGSSSDDIFYLKREPGKSLIVGAGYIALETAGFLRGMGYDVNVLVRTDILGGMDLDCSNRIVKFLKARGIGFIENSTIHSIVKEEKTKRLKVIVKNTFDKYDTGPRIVDMYDTVFFAIGRYSVANSLGLEGIGVKLSGSGRIVVDDWQTSSLPHIYSVGDCMEGGIALTPVAIRTGQLLARRLFDHNKTEVEGKQAPVQIKDQKLKMSYDLIPTTVFTPVEYAYVGLSEEEARAKYKNVEVYYKNFKPLIWSLPDIGGMSDRKDIERTVDDEKKLKALIKVIVDKNNNEKVLGIHYCGPDAGEIIQGCSFAFKCGNLTKEHLDSTMAIHPTIAEELCYLNQKKSDPDFITL